MIDPNRVITVGRLIELAKGLKSEHGEANDYDRALAELVTDAAGLSMEEGKVLVAEKIGIPEKSLSKYESQFMNDQFVLQQFNLILNLHQDIDDIINSNEASMYKLDKIKVKNDLIGQLVMTVLPE
jgi:hypothetical protein